MESPSSLNKEAVEFWERNELPDPTSWDSFKAAFEKDHPIKIEPKPGAGFECLQAIMTKSKEGQPITKAYFSEVVNWFGPLKRNATIPMMSRMMFVMSQGCFFGDLESDAANNRLKNSPVGTYLLRLGHKNPGCYVISVCREANKTREVGHILVEYEEGFWSCKQFNITKYDRISKVIEQMKKLRPKNFVSHLPGSPFISIFPYFENEDSLMEPNQNQ
eukprot:TRINITY_DN10376_c0_g1_i1.p1 TRINITY_DN10376_c0_g1~~TRINITY_DN10376_c0_g1_i1.p1  ORF type:complete len:218 (-),score=59.05 TRINITY_DN10376_c0_g1_i1:98-751(-)